MRVQTIQALVFAGGSAFGLAAADGVVGALAAEGRGHPTPAGPVPIVPAAIIYDLLIGDSGARPDAQAGRMAFEAATDAPVQAGNIGAGTGAIVAGWRGPAAVRKGGLGSALVSLPDGAMVGALVVANAVGDAFTLEGTPLTGGDAAAIQAPVGPRPVENTTLAVVVTDIRLERSDLSRLIVRAHDAYAVCFRPSHTRYDGDAVFAVSCGMVESDVDMAGEAAFMAVGQAIETALRAARPVGGVQAMEEPG